MPRRSKTTRTVSFSQLYSFNSTFHTTQVSPIGQHTRPQGSVKQNSPSVQNPFGINEVTHQLQYILYNPHQTKPRTQIQQPAEVLVEGLADVPAISINQKSTGCAKPSTLIRESKAITISVSSGPPERSRMASAGIF